MERSCPSAAEVGPLLLRVTESLPCAFNDCLLVLLSDESETTDLSNVPNIPWSTCRSLGGARAARLARRDLLPFPPASTSWCHHHSAFRALSPRGQGHGKAWFLLMLSSLNHLYCGHHGSRSAVHGGPPSPAQGHALDRLLDLALSFAAREVSPGESRDWTTVLQKTSLSYSGQEVQAAIPLTVAQVEAALPPAGVAGSIPMIEVVDEGMRAPLLDPDMVRLDDAEVDGPLARARLHAADGEITGLVELLVRRGLAEPIAEEEVWHHRGRPVLAGIFGVEKKGEQVSPTDSRPRLRLIINMVPSNSLQRVIPGDIATLPTTGQWNQIHLLQHEVMLMSSSDRKCFFYLFSLPSIWKRAMTLEGHFPRSLHSGRREDKHVLTRYAICAVPMGWISAVGLCQHAHRRMLAFRPGTPSWTPENREAEKVCFDMSQETRKDRPLPMKEWFYRIYIDNYDEVEIFSRDRADARVGSRSESTERTARQYDEWGALGNDSKDIDRQYKMESLGYVTDGKEGRQDLPAGYTRDLVALTMWMCSQPAVSQRYGQVLAGRWVRAQQVCRATSGCFERLWWWLTRGPWDAPIPLGVCAELLVACATAPFLFADFRVPFDPLVSVSDASERGCGVCISAGLTAEGRSVAVAEPSSGIKACETRLGVLSFFDGIGGARQALDLLGCEPAAFVCSETDPAAIRVVESQWPGTLQLGSVEEIDERTVWKELYLKFPLILLWLTGGGFPCQDVSGLHATRKGMDGKRSSLLTEMLRVIEGGRRFFAGRPVRIAAFGENVSSMDDSDLGRINDEIGLIPVDACAGDVSWSLRPRLYWLDWELQVLEEMYGELAKERKRKLTLYADLPACSSWLDAGCSFPQAEKEGRLPTFTRATTKKRPPFRPAGIAGMTEEEKLRWQADAFAQPAYQYANRWCVHAKDGNLRPASAAERERILGFEPGHTLPAVPSAMYSARPLEAERLRKSLLGNSFSCPMFAWLVSHLLVDAGLATRVPSPTEVASGVRLDLARRLEVESVDVVREPTRSERPADLLLVERLGAGVDHRGSDIRVGLRTSLAPSSWPRREVPCRWWNWRTILSFGWRLHHGEHINALELRSTLSALRWRARQRRHQRCRAVHLSDSFVSIGVLTKRRSASLRLAPIVRRVNALELASGIHIYHAFCRSSNNPADAPSRAFVRFKKSKRSVGRPPESH